MSQQLQQLRQTQRTMPILSVDESLNTEERLTDNAVNNILPARYLLDDETPDDMFRRVANNVAKAERMYDGGEDAWANEFYDLMSTLRFMPNSPTLMNAGGDLQQLSACISGDTPIYTEDGLKRMDKITEGDMVLTHSGQFKEVTSHWSNGIKETFDVKRGTSRGDNYSVTATPDHEFLTNDGSWKELQEIDDAAHPTASPDVEFPESFDLTRYTTIMGKDKPVVSDGGLVKVKNGDDPRTGQFDKQYSNVVASVENSDAFAYLAGAYLAEGDVDGSDLRFTIGAHEDSFERLITDALSELFDVHVAVMESNYGNWKTISASSPFIADLFVTQFGTGSTKKRIPKWVFAAPEEYQQSMLDGILDGDAHESENGWKLTLANPTLAYESSLLARNLGYDTNFTLEAENKLSSNPTSCVRISKNEGKTYMDTVSTRSGEMQEVFDMEVADDHSFVAGDFVVHNCFVLEVGDSMAEPDENGRESILDSAKNAGEIFKSGGGVGYTFGFLRPKGTHIESTDSKTSGPMQFMRLFDEVCNTVKQGGKRRGAQMAIMPIMHPDVGRFAVSKRTEGDYSNFNISVGLTDEFIEAVIEDENYTFKDPRTEFETPFEIVQQTKNFFAPSKEAMPESVVDENIWRDHDDIDVYDWESEETVTLRAKWERRFETAEAGGVLDVGEPLTLPARFIWDIMIDGAWRNGEPGLFYMEETNRKHSFDVEEHPEYKIHATNPCAEQPLCNFEACNLGHINLSLMVDEQASTYDEWRENSSIKYADHDEAMRYYVSEAVDYDELDRVIKSGTRFLDNVVTMSDFPLEEITETVGSMRKIGLGVMGWAQMLYQFGIPYGSEASYAAAEEIMSYIDAQATRYSHHLAANRGCFDAWEDSKYADPQQYSEWFESHVHEPASEYPDGYPIRNHNVTTVAPTGTTSMLGDTSGGIEPVFSVAYQKNVGEDIQGDDMLVEFDSYFVSTLAENNIDVEETKAEATRLMKNNEWDGVQSLSTVPDGIAEVFVTTNDLSSRQHGMMQRAFQAAVDSGISKTVNLPKEADHADVHDAYMLALTDEERGAPIKGLTVYRDQSREEQVKTTQQYSDLEIENAVEMLDDLGYEIDEPESESVESRGEN